MKRLAGAVMVAAGWLGLVAIGFHPVAATAVTAAVMLAVWAWGRPMHRPESRAFPAKRETVVQQQRRRARYADAETKLAVLKRDGYRCVACGATDDLTVDHVYPWSKGGSNRMENLEVLCAACNVAKSDKLEMPPFRELGG